MSVLFMKELINELKEFVLLILKPFLFIDRFGEQ